MTSSLWTKLKQYELVKIENVNTKFSFFLKFYFLIQYLPRLIFIFNLKS